MDVCGGVLNTTDVTACGVTKLRGVTVCLSHRLTAVFPPLTVSTSDTVSVRETERTHQTSPAAAVERVSMPTPYSLLTALFISLGLHWWHQRQLQCWSLYGDLQWE